MQAAFLPASSGWQWVRDGFRLFRKQPLAMFTWALVNSLLIIFFVAAQVVGPIVVMTIAPSLVVMSLAACKHIEADRTMLPSMWGKPLKQPGVFRKLFLLGLLGAAINLTAWIITFTPFAAAFAESIRIASMENTIEPILSALRTPIILLFTVTVLIVTVFWYAPVLIAWHGLRLMQALFFSCIACWRNKWAFLVYGATWILILLFLDLCTGLLVTFGLSPEFASTLRIPFVILAIAVFYCSLYPSYTAVFGINNASPNLDNGHGAQA